MGNRLRLYIERIVYEGVSRTLGGAFWLRPDPACNAIIEGVIGKALKLYPDVRMHGYTALSNHLHYMLSATMPEQIPLFLDYMLGNIARQLNKLRGRSGVFWSRRTSIVPIADKVKQIERLAYILGQGPAAGLVASPLDWPGASSAQAMVADMVVPATYGSLDAARRNEQRKAPLPREEITEDVTFRLAPLPVWEHLSPDELRAAHMRQVQLIEEEHAGQAVKGAAAVMTEEPEQSWPLKRSRAPLCHASTPRIWKRFANFFGVFQTLCKEASHRLRRMTSTKGVDVPAQYPKGALARPRWYIPAPASLAQVWLRDLDDADLAVA